MMNCSGFTEPGQFLFGAWSYIGSWLGPETTIFVCPGNPAWKKEGTVPYTQGTCGTPSLGPAPAKRKSPYDDGLWGSG